MSNPPYNPPPVPPTGPAGPAGPAGPGGPGGPYPGGPYPGGHGRPPKRKSWFGRHKVLTTLIAVVAFIVIISVFANMGGGNGGPNAGATPSADGGQTGSKSSHGKDVGATKSSNPNKGKVTFVVKGDGDPTIMYGSDSDSRSGDDHNSQFGTAANLPWKRTMHTSDKVMYYNLNAQLQGKGDITCAIKVDGKTIKSGHAAGGYQICNVQIAPGAFGGWNAE